MPRRVLLFNLVGATKIKITQDELSYLIREVVMVEIDINNQQSNDIIKVFAFKFLIYFRQQIPKDWLPMLVGSMLNLLSSENELFINGSLLVLEKFLYMRDLNTNTNLFEEVVNNPEILGSLVNSLIAIVSKNLNQFAMKCLYKTISLVRKEYYGNIAKNIFMSLREILKLNIENPVNDEYNYFNFETIAFCLRNFHAHSNETYREMKSDINNILNSILERQIIDLQGYLFQIYSLELYLDGEFNDMIKVILVISRIFSRM